MRERIEPVAFDPVDRRPDDGLLAHDAARIAAPVVAKAGISHGPSSVEMLQARLEVHVEVAPRVVVVDGSVRAAVREGVGILNVNVDAAERVDQIFRRVDAQDDVTIEARNAEPLRHHALRFGDPAFGLRLVYLGPLSARHYGHHIARHR